ncbi:MAG: ABC transporter substrate-binding protein [Candidatus Poribacteria bacterium]|nr:ABC transporter substrate-binding protein [Candidatus Poribacteria bacterium]MDE0504164.1 ABC transporter substrate-binding protein [Candidatus Poribacteria bacterium]
MKIALSLGIAVLTAGFCGCAKLSSNTSSGQAPAQLPDEFLIGVVMPLSGKYSQGPDDPNLVRFLNGFNLARDEINSARRGGAQIRFIVEDDGGTGEGSAEAFDKLIHEDRVIAILGPLGSVQAPTALPVAQENEIVAISPSAAAQGLGAIGNFAFRVNLAVDKLIPEGVRLTHEKLGYQRVVKLATSDDAYCRSADAIFSEALAARGIQVLATETVKLADTDYTEQLTRTKDLNPDGVIVSAHPLNLPRVLVQGREVGIPNEVPFIAPLLTLTEVQAAGAAAEGAITFTAWTSTANTTGNREFVRDYRKKYNGEPNVFSALAYTSVHILMNAILRAKSTDSHAIRNTLAGTKDFDAVLGRFSFDDAGDAVYNPVMLIVRNEEFEVLE